MEGKGKSLYPIAPEVMRKASRFVKMPHTKFVAIYLSRVSVLLINCNVCSSHDTIQNQHNIHKHTLTVIGLTDCNMFKLCSFAADVHSQTSVPAFQGIMALCVKKVNIIDHCCLNPSFIKPS